MTVLRLGVLTVLRLTPAQVGTSLGCPGSWGLSPLGSPMGQSCAPRSLSAYPGSATQSLGQDSGSRGVIQRWGRWVPVGGPESGGGVCVFPPRVPPTGANGGQTLVPPESVPVGPCLYGPGGALAPWGSAAWCCLPGPRGPYPGHPLAFQLSVEKSEQNHTAPKADPSQLPW